MDPNANLAAQESLLLNLTDAHGIRADRMHELTKLRHALTAWLSSGGFAPRWERHPIAADYYTNRDRR